MTQTEPAELTPTTAAKASTSSANRSCVASPSLLEGDNAPLSTPAGDFSSPLENGDNIFFSNTSAGGEGGEGDRVGPLGAGTDTSHPIKQEGRGKDINIFSPEQDEQVSSTSFVSSIVDNMRTAGVGPVRTITLPHLLHDVHKGWIKSRPADSPKLPLTIALHLPSYKKLGLDIPHRMKSRTSLRRSIDATHKREHCVMDSGAQMTLCPTKFAQTLGIAPHTLLPLQSKVNSASQDPIELKGGMLVEATWCSPTGETLSTLQLMYVSSAVTEIYMSRQACEQLGVIQPNFPLPQLPIPCNNCGTEPGKSVELEISPVTLADAVLPPCTNTGVIRPGDETCSCPVRTLPPTDRAQLPCKPTVENLPIMKKYILQRYSSSAFNTCERQVLPLMESSPPLRLFVQPDAEPVAVHTPASVPLHWQEAVKGGLDRDVRLGVLEKVDVNVPTVWSSRMVITPKPNSNQPRRVVDFQPLNLKAPRQTHHTANPYQLVSSIPPNQVKSVLDCWHGYHSVPIAEQDRHLTTFLTPWGRYKYRTTPQGFLSAGDGYTHRSDIITAEVPKLRKCIDDSLLFDDNIETNFYRVCEYLELCSRNGMIFSPKKFQFASKTVQYVGFLVTPEGIRPTDEFLKNISSFPTPKTLSDIRSWYGCVAQISYAFATAPAMLAFKHLLSSKVPFQWSPDLEKAFELSKDEIIRQCMTGVRSFNPKLHTILATDWSKSAVGFWLCQKHCNCTSTKPGCCNTGWQIVHCGSRFCNPAESNYAPIEGEGAAAVWALDKCKFFLLGMKDFQLAMDHKPLISLFGQQEFVNIPNPRLTSQKLKTMAFRFTPVHVAGKKNVVADCLSRRSNLSNKLSEVKAEETVLDISNVGPEYQNHLGPPGWVSNPPVNGPPPVLSTLTATDPPAGLLAHLCTSPTVEEMQDAGDSEALIKGVALSALASLNMTGWEDHLTVAAAFKHPAVLTWQRLISAASSCPVYQSLHSLVIAGPGDDISSWPEVLLPYYSHRKDLLAIDQIVMLNDRPIIPTSLRAEVLEHLHAGHAGVTHMYARATSCMYWPNMKTDIVKTRSSCGVCNLIAPSNPATPPFPVIQPSYPFSDLCADFFQYSGKSYLATADRYSNWLSIFQLARDDSANIIRTFRDLSSCWGVPLTITTDGASVFTSKELKEWMERWGITHRISSYYYPRANKRAEVAVKSAKRMIRDNLGPAGTLNTDKLARALLQHRNCPDPNTGMSPSQVIFGRVLRDHLPLQPGKFQIREEWRIDAELRERALARRHLAKHEHLLTGTKPLPELLLGDSVMVQDQSTHKPGRWTKTGKIVESLGFESYLVKLDGSNVLTKRNRRFLKRIIPFIVAADPLKTPPKPVSHSNPVPSHPPPPWPTPTPTPPPSSSQQQTYQHPMPQTSQQPVLQNQQLMKTNKPKIPLHLREKWIVNKNLDRNVGNLPSARDASQTNI